MPAFIVIGEHALIDSRRIVAAVAARSQPIIRLLKALPDDRIIDLTYGYPRETVLLLDNGTLALVSLSVRTLAGLLETEARHVRPES